MNDLELIEIARDQLHLDDGKLFWRVAKTRTEAGQRAGSYDAQGYRQIKLLGKGYREHRIIFAIHHGRMPIGEIDHINGIKDDNRPANLREVSHSENLRSFQKRTKSASGYRGVVRSSTKGKWIAQAKHDGVAYYFGTWSCKEDAAKARDRGVLKLGFPKQALNFPEGTNGYE